MKFSILAIIAVALSGGIIFEESQSDKKFESVKCLRVIAIRSNCVTGQVLFVDGMSWCDLSIDNDKLWAGSLSQFYLTSDEEAEPDNCTGTDELFCC